MLDMLEMVKQELLIENAAINLLKTIAFLCATEEEQEELINVCRGKGVQYINRYLINYRKKKIVDRGFEECSDFEKAYYINKKAALERLFQEPITDFKLSSLKSDDPRHIYQIHRDRGLFIRFDELISFA